MSSQGPLFKVRLLTGRVLGPLDLERIGALIRKRIITGAESARRYPSSEWKKITRFEEINQLLKANAEGKVDSVISELNGKPPPTILLDPSYSDTKIEGEAQVDGDQKQQAGSGHETQPILGTKSEAIPAITQTVQQTRPGEKDRHEGGGNLGTQKSLKGIHTGITQRELSKLEVSREKTILLSRSELLAAKKKFKKKAIFSSTAVAVALTILIIELGFEDEEAVQLKKYVPVTVKASIPAPSRTISSEAINKNIREGLKWYREDNLAGYRKAVKLFSDAYRGDRDSGIVPALLADCYLKLIELSLKDEGYLSTISKLVDLAKATDRSSIFTLMVETDYLLALDRSDAALELIIQYSKQNSTTEFDLFYQMARIYFEKREYVSAMRYLAQIPETAIQSPKVYALRGMVSAELGEEESALSDFDKAILLSPRHAVSRLKRVEINMKAGNFDKTKDDLKFLVSNPELMNSRELARAFYYSGRLSELAKDKEAAKNFLTLAVALHPNQPEYLFELYTLKSKEGKSLLSLRSKARMYFFLSEGEKMIQNGKYQDALIEFLKARQEDTDSPIPLIKIGAMFEQLQDYANARENYKLALEKKKSDPEVAAKYIRALMMGYEYEEAQKIMNEFRGVSKGRSSLDKAAADFYLRVGSYSEAALFYRKAMSRDNIDPETYIGFGDLLVATKNPKEAPFYYSLARRYDPYNLRALFGHAKAIAEAESIENAIRYLQGELKRRSTQRSEILTAIAEFEFQRGQPDQALLLIKEAMESNPEYGKPWKLEAEHYLKKATSGNDPGLQQKLKDKALEALQSYIDRNPSDADARIERYKIFVSRGDFTQANQELLQVYAVYPRFPNLHFFKGALHSASGQAQDAIAEYELELKTSPTNLSALVAIGREYLVLNDGAKALPYLAKGMQVEPHSAEAKHLAGYANYLLKNFEGAVALYRAALTIDPQNALIYKRMGLAYRELGDNTNAAMAFKRALELEPNAPEKQELLRFIR